MSQYRKKPVIIEAFKITENFSNTNIDTPSWFVDAVINKIAKTNNNCVIITTLEGEMRADINDWIIKGVKGELYPCKPDIFEATYERV